MIVGRMLQQRQVTLARAADHHATWTHFSFSELQELCKGIGLLSVPTVRKRHWEYAGHPLLHVSTEMHSSFAELQELWKGKQLLSVPTVG